jgi:ATP-dependent DNA helicase PIF1
MTEITHTDEIDRFLAVAGRSNVFLTGKAGTGKTTVSRYFRETFGGNLAVVAPTGIAALQAGGTTIHSFFGVKPGEHLTDDWVPRVRASNRFVIAKLDALLVDEASMVRADLLGFIDRALRYFRDQSKLFGGVPVVLVGDPYQLPPVVTTSERVLVQEYASPFFFDAPEFIESGFATIELTKAFRQADSRFLGLLDAVRKGWATDEDIEGLNRRAWSGVPSDDHLVDEAVNGFVVLCPYRAQVDRINALGMSRLSTESRWFHGLVVDDFKVNDCPVDVDLELKLGARVMVVANNHDEGYVNGQTGVVTRFDVVERHTEDGEVDERDAVYVRLDRTDREVAVTAYTWDRKQYEVTTEDGKRKVSSSVVGRYTQMPVKPAWASTIHKCQGMTIDKGIVDLRQGIFEAGQLYVALSRMTNMNGLELTRPIQRADIMVNEHVQRFMRSALEGVA